MQRRRHGFTLIELLIVVVIVGILASIAIPKFANTRRRAYFATMKGDLRNLMSSQEAWAAGNNGAYMPAATVSATTPYPGAMYQPSAHVTVKIEEPVGNTWSATATHSGDVTGICGIFVGNTPPGDPNPAQYSGEPKCK